jgi:hypothetical protein
MITPTRPVSRVSRDEVEPGSFAIIALFCVLFCGAALLVSFLFASYGFDMSPGFF